MCNKLDKIGALQDFDLVISSLMSKLHIFIVSFGGLPAKLKYLCSLDCENEFGLMFFLFIRLDRSKCDLYWAGWN